MLPKASLLRPSWATYSVIFGKSSFDFQGGEERSVPVAVALELRKLKGKGDKPLFRVRNLPTIVKPDVPKPKVIKQNEESTDPRQLTLTTPWLLNAV